ncbi:hypothetical protein IKQ19_18030 [Candidatus Saccharibacteria bacterium]|nr:hypothetical protein [Candidatus Saccharibacteria bacterium]
MTLAELADKIKELIGSRKRNQKIQDFCDYRKKRNEPLGAKSSVENNFKQYFAEAEKSRKDGLPHDSGRAYEMLLAFYEFLEKENDKIVLHNLPENPFKECLSIKERRLIHEMRDNFNNDISCKPQS